LLPKLALVLGVLVVLLLAPDPEQATIGETTGLLLLCFVLVEWVFADTHHHFFCLPICFTSIFYFVKSIGLLLLIVSID
jgi:hypothetical protein